MCFIFVQTYNEVQRCFLTVGSVYPEDLFGFLMNVSYFEWQNTDWIFICVMPVFILVLHRVQTWLFGLEVWQKSFVSNIGS